MPSHLHVPQFQFQKVFHFKQFGLVYVRRLDVKTVLFQAIHFSISTQFSSIWPIDRTLSGSTTPGLSEPGSGAMKMYSAFPTAPDYLKPLYLIVQWHIHDTSWRFLPHCRAAVGVFYSPSWLANVFSLITCRCVLSLIMCICVFSWKTYWCVLSWIICR